MIAIACDHSALALKKEVMAFLDENGYAYHDFGTYTEESCDYPYYAALAGRAVVSGAYEVGIVLCGTGIGVSIAANKIEGVRCALCGDTYSAAMARAHNNANMLALGARVIGAELAKVIVETFLTTTFLGGRHARRVDMINALDARVPGALASDPSSQKK